MPFVGDIAMTATMYALANGETVAEERRRPVPIHILPLRLAGDRQHALSSGCWCRPTVEVVHHLRSAHRMASLPPADPALMGTEYRADHETGGS